MDYRVRRRRSLGKLMKCLCTREPLHGEDETVPSLDSLAIKDYYSSKTSGGSSQDEQVERVSDSSGNIEQAESSLCESGSLNNELNLGIYNKDKRDEFSVLVDGATGGASIQDGEVELMLHRHILHDHGRGVEEPLDEIVCVDNDKTCEGLTVLQCCQS